jgi:hypothetical protein
VREFTLEELEDLEVNYINVIKKSHGKNRWSERFTVVFEFEGKHYIVNTEEGNTEEQDYSCAMRYPGMWDNKVNCDEVDVYVEMVPVTKWRKIDG